MSRRCKDIIYGAMGLIGIVVAAPLIKLLFFNGLFTPLLVLNGAKTMKMEVNIGSQDSRTRARFRFSDYSDGVKIEGNLNTKEPGTYTLTYTFDEYQKTVKRKVNVIDMTPPKVDLKGDSPIRAFGNESFQEPGYQTGGSYNGDISKSVERRDSVNIKKQGTYMLIYTVKDASSNTTGVKRSTQVYADPANTKPYYGHSSYDNTMGGWWSDKNKNRRRATGARGKELLEKYDSCYQGPEEKVIYLTSDGGGNDTTYIKQITEVLKENDVQATHLLTRNYIRTEADFIRQPVQDGNIAGNHS